MLKDATAEQAQMPNKILFQIRRLNKIKYFFERCNNSKYKSTDWGGKHKFPKMFFRVILELIQPTAKSIS